MWQWYNHAEALALARGKTLLRINIDETSVCLHPGCGRGAVFVTQKWLRDGGGQHVPKWKQRRYMSHVAVICDRPDVQAVLPQFVIGNGGTLLQRSIAALRRGRPTNVRLLRKTTAWNTSRLTACLIRQIAAVLAVGGVVPCNTQVVLLVDAARIHYTPEVLRACRTARFWLIVVPAQMTFLLQPLDTHAFAIYKTRLQCAYQRARIGSLSANGDISIAEFLPCIDHAIRSTLEARPWAAAFDSDGFGNRQRSLGGRVKRRLQLSADPDVPSTRPTDAQLSTCFPRRTRPDFALLWSLFDEPVAPLAAVPHPDDAGLVLMHGAAPVVPLIARLRRGLDSAERAVPRLSPGVAGMPPLLRRYRHPPDLD